MARISVTYRTYRWNDRDPIVDAVATVVKDEHLKNEHVHQISGVATATLNNWFSGKTKKPQNTTVSAVTSALGYVRRDDIDEDGNLVVGYRKAKRYDYREEIEKQASWMIRQGRGPKKKKPRKKKRGNGSPAKAS
jgi:hypothetical protein